MCCIVQIMYPMVEIPKNTEIENKETVYSNSRYRYRLHEQPPTGPGPAGEIMSLDWPGNASGSPRMSWRKWPGDVWASLLSILPPQPLVD